jgi:hypothetical protein
LKDRPGKGGLSFLGTSFRHTYISESQKSKRFSTTPGHPPPTRSSTTFAPQVDLKY